MIKFIYMHHRVLIDELKKKVSLLPPFCGTNPHSIRIRSAHSSLPTTSISSCYLYYYVSMTKKKLKFDSPLVKSTALKPTTVLAIILSKTLYYSKIVATIPNVGKN